MVLDTHQIVSTTETDETPVVVTSVSYENASVRYPETELNPTTKPKCTASEQNLAWLNTARTNNRRLEGTIATACARHLAIVAGKDRAIAKFKSELEEQASTHKCKAFPVSYTHLTLPTICSV